MDKVLLSIGCAIGLIGFCIQSFRLVDRGIRVRELESLLRSEEQMSRKISDERWAVVKKHAQLVKALEVLIEEVA